jgi:hypothetical protein
MSYSGSSAKLMIDGVGLPRPKWRTPMLTEDAVADVTMNVSSVPGSDGYDASPGYSTQGNS